MDKLLRKNKAGAGTRNEWTNTGSFISRPASGWLHPDEQLAAHAGVCYGVRYIGSLQVLESMKALDFETRTSITKESINRVCFAVGLKTPSRKSRKSAKIDQYLAMEPTLEHVCVDVNMTITTESITIFEMDTGALVTHHLMPSISFASGGDQDTTDFVAFVAKDEYGRACHVIECGGGLAQDVITTIGQAFELRFKNYLLHKSMAPAPAPIRLNTSHEDYYNDRPDAIPPSPPFLASPEKQRAPSPMYQFPRSNQPVPDVVDVPPLISFDDTTDGAAAALYPGSAVPLECDAKMPLYAKANKRNGELDSFDMRPFSKVLNSASSPVASQSPTFNHRIMGHNAMPYAEPWFHGRISRQKCDELLLRDGDFLVRESPSSPGQFVLSGCHNGHIRHLLLIDPEGKVRTKDQLFNSVSHLVDYHMKNCIPIVSADSELLLLNPILRTQREM